MLKNYTPGKLSAFFSQYQSLSFQKGETILRSEDSPQGVYYIKAGFVKLNTISVNGRERTFNIFKRGAYFPMMWAIAEIPNSYFYQAQTAVVIQRAPKKELLIFLKNNPDVLFELTRRILIGLDGLLNNIEYMFCGNSYHRVIGTLLLSAERFGKVEADGEITIMLPLTHQDIADIAGISRETASLAINKLGKKKIITYKKRLIAIKNIETLEEELGLSKKEIKVPIAS